LSRFKRELRCLPLQLIVSPSTVLTLPGTSRRSIDRHALGWHDGYVVAEDDEFSPHQKRRAADQ
jgi:hypothetical protein